MVRKRPFQDWKFAHLATVVTVIAVCAAYFIFTSDANLLVASIAIVVAGLLAIFGAQLHVWSAARRNNGRR
jgi:uncharacterized membrane protein